MTEPTITQPDIDVWEKLGPAIFHMDVSGPQALANYREAAVAELRAENERLREALGTVASDCQLAFDALGNSGPEFSSVRDAFAIVRGRARAALSQKETSHDD